MTEILILLVIIYYLSQLTFMKRVTDYIKLCNIFINSFFSIEREIRMFKLM